jgi:hypothetical protein
MSLIPRSMSPAIADVSKLDTYPGTLFSSAPRLEADGCFVSVLMNRHPGGSGPKVRNADVDGGLRAAAGGRGMRQGWVGMGYFWPWAATGPINGSNSLSAPRMHFARDCILPTILSDSIAKHCIPRITFQCWPTDFSAAAQKDGICMPCHAMPVGLGWARSFGCLCLQTMAFDGLGPGIFSAGRNGVLSDAGLAC